MAPAVASPPAVPRLSRSPSPWGPGRRRVLLLRVTVEISADRSGTILVHLGDSPSRLSEAFCAKHGLQPHLVSPLALHIQENLDATGIVTGGGAGGGCLVEQQVAQSSSASRPPGRAAALLAWREQQEKPDAAACALAAPEGGQALHPAATTAAGERELQQGFGASLENCAGPRYQTLHRDALLRQRRLQHLREQVEREYHDAHIRAEKVAPGTVRYASWHRPSEEKAARGSRLFQDAAQREQRLQRLQRQQELERRRREDAEATFRPSIRLSQRGCRAIPRAVVEQRRACALQRLERLRREGEEAALAECTFQPCLTPRSSRLRALRRPRRPNASVHEQLFEEAALRRRVRLSSGQEDEGDEEGQGGQRQQGSRGAVAAAPAFPLFMPDIGRAARRPPNDDSREDFVSRLAYSKSLSEQRLSATPGGAGAGGAFAFAFGPEEGEGATQFPFHPRVGRAPLVERNRFGVQIGHFLHAAKREGPELAALVQAQAARETASAGLGHPNSPGLSRASREAFQGAKLRKYEEIYRSLTHLDPSGRLRSSTLDRGGLGREMEAFLRPLLAYLEETGACLDFVAFRQALDCQCEQSSTPSAHLFVQRQRCRSGSRASRSTTAGTVEHTAAASPDLVVTPRATAGAASASRAQFGERSRPKDIPLHERLYRERDARQQRLLEMQLVEEEKRLRECTFHPNSRRKSKPPRPPPRVRADTSPLLSTSPWIPPLLGPRGGVPAALLRQLACMSSPWWSTTPEPPLLPAPPAPPAPPPVRALLAKADGDAESQLPEALGASVRSMLVLPPPRTRAMSPGAAFPEHQQTQASADPCRASGGTVQSGLSSAAPLAGSG